MSLRAAVAAALFVTFAGLAAAAPAAASVRYSFLTETGSFTVLARDFITLRTEMEPAELESCAPMESCPGSKFIPEDQQDNIEFSPEQKQAVYRFNPDAFTTPGRHDTVRGTPRAILIVTIVDDRLALSVSEMAEDPTKPGNPTGTQPVNPVSPVPEPGTWLMMLSGFGVLGLTLRRSRRGHVNKSKAS